SKRRDRAKAEVSRAHRRVADARKDSNHQLSRRLVDGFDTVVFEDLAIANMVRSAKGTVERPGRNVAAKAGLNRSILDAGWGQFTSILTAKAESAGRRVVLVSPAFTSIDCHICGARCIRPRQDTVVCPVHGDLDADRH